jgi:hypothetical protein
MAKADRVHSTPRTSSSEFHLAVNRIRLSQLIRDPFVAAAFRAAEEDGFEPGPVYADQPKALNGGTAERVRTMVEG